MSTVPGESSLQTRQVLGQVAARRREPGFEPERATLLGVPLIGLERDELIDLAAAVVALVEAIDRGQA